jgi:hypothetical protein
MKVCIKITKSGISKKRMEVISSFIKFLQSQLPLSSNVEVKFTNDQTKTGTTGVRIPGSKIYILSKGRMLVDILRTLSHEWVHEYQTQKMGVDEKEKIQDIGGPEENMSNVLSGIFIKKFDKQNPNYKETIYEQCLINESLPNLTGVDEVVRAFEKTPELLKHLGFRNLTAVKQYIRGVEDEDFDELRNDIEEFYKEREKYFEKEMDEFERVSQDLSRDEGIDVSVDEVINSFKNSKETTLTDEVWSKLENTESNQIKKGEIKKVIELAKKYNKSNPMILKYGDRYHLVAGNTRLCTAAALGMKPQVLIAEI